MNRPKDWGRTKIGTSIFALLKFLGDAIGRFKWRSRPGCELRQRPAAALPRRGASATSHSDLAAHWIVLDSVRKKTASSRRGCR